MTMTCAAMSPAVDAIVSAFLAALNCSALVWSSYADALSF